MEVTKLDRFSSKSEIRVSWVVDEFFLVRARDQNSAAAWFRKNTKLISSKMDLSKVNYHQGFFQVKAPRPFWTETTLMQWCDSRI